jgi:hypothetical protein
MPREHCHRCGVTTELKVTVSHETEEQVDGTVRRVKVTTYHCEACGTFIRSEVAPEEEGDAGN